MANEAIFHIGVWSSDRVATTAMEHLVIVTSPVVNEVINCCHMSFIVVIRARQKAEQKPRTAAKTHAVISATLEHVAGEGGKDEPDPERPPTAGHLVLSEWLRITLHPLAVHGPLAARRLKARCLVSISAELGAAPLHRPRRGRRPSVRRRYPPANQRFSDACLGLPVVV